MESCEQTKWRQPTYWGWVLGQAEAALSTQHPAELAKSCTSWWSSNRWTKLHQTFITIRAATSPGLLHSAEIRNHPTCSDEPWAWWPSWAETPGQCGFRKSSSWAGLHVPVAELCAGQWAAGKRWVHPAHIHHGMSSCWINTDSRHQTPLLVPLQPIWKLSKCFVSNTCFNPLGCSLVRL